MEKDLPEIINADKSLNELCQNSIDLIEYARGITAKQININSANDILFHRKMDCRRTTARRKQSEIWTASDKKAFRSSD